jgi:hypothetical protein
MDNTLTSALAALGGSVIGATTPVLSNFVLQRSLTQRELTNREIAQREDLYAEFIRQGRLATQRRFRRVWKTLTILLRCTPW